MILTLNQREIYDSLFEIESEIKWNLVTGGPGSGKSLMIKLIHESLTKENIPHYILATTNLAARNVNGQTFHSAIGGGQKLIKTMNKIDGDIELEPLWRSRDPMAAVLDRTFVDKIQSHFIANDCPFKFLNAENATHCPTPENCKIVIIIDEIGMVEVSLLYVLLFHIQRKDRVSFILFGDENQLEPIRQKSVGLFEIFEWMEERGYLRSSYLKGNVRHEGSDYLMKFVSDWWNENRDRSELGHLKFGGDEKEFEKLLHPKLVICGRHKVVRHYQDKLLSEFKGEEILIKPLTKKLRIKDLPDDAYFESKADTERLLVSIRVKKNVPIIITSNINVLIHGNRCKFLEFKENTVKVMMEEKEYLIPRVTYLVISKNSVYEIQQFPFNLFLAVTAHGSQGMTINMPVLLKLRDMWSEKQKYVALTRITRSNFIYYDEDPLLAPTTLSNPIVNIDTVERNKCSQCNVIADKLHLVAAQTKRRVTDESLSLKYLCNDCMNKIYS